MVAPSTPSIRQTSSMRQQPSENYDHDPENDGQEKIEPNCKSTYSKENSSGTKSKLARCEWCHKIGVVGKTVLKCAGCIRVCYCNDQCQLHHWPQHRLVCGCTELTLSDFKVHCKRERTKGILSNKRRRPARKRSKSVRWPKNFVSETENQVAVICNILKGEKETIRQAESRLRSECERGHAHNSRTELQRLCEVGKILAFTKRIRKVLDTPKRLLKELGRFPEDDVNAFIQNPLPSASHHLGRSPAAASSRPLLRPDNELHCARTGIHPCPSASHTKCASHKESMDLDDDGDIIA
eukprot:jgi/Bigna1/85558/estExt_fgenesh1_pg.C_40375